VNVECNENCRENVGSSAETGTTSGVATVVEGGTVSEGSDGVSAGVEGGTVSGEDSSEKKSSTAIDRCIATRVSPLAYL